MEGRPPTRGPPESLTGPCIIHELLASHLLITDFLPRTPVGGVGAGTLVMSAARDGTPSPSPPLFQTRRPGRVAGTRSPDTPPIPLPYGLRVIEISAAVEAYVTRNNEISAEA